MLNEIIYALIFATLPIFIFTYGILWWINYRNIKQGKSPLLDDEFELEGLNEMPKDKESAIQKKWMTFGGGFYGMVGLLTYMVSEYREIKDMVVNFQGFENGIISTLIELLIDFLIQSFTNIVDAVTWPWFWMKELNGASFWILFVAAYLGYYVAVETLKYQHSTKRGSE